jgi:hypothetical protein
VRPPAPAPPVRSGTTPRPCPASAPAVRSTRRWARARPRGVEQRMRRSGGRAAAGRGQRLEREGWDFGDGAVRSCQEGAAPHHVLPLPACCAAAALPAGARGGARAERPGWRKHAATPFAS